MSTSAFDDEAITVADAAVGVTTATASLGTTRAATRAVFTVETGSVRYRYEGTAATAAVGHLVAVGDSFIIEGTNNIDNLSMIRATTTTATVHASYER